MYLKRLGMLFFKLGANRYGLGLSNDLLFIIIAQEAANKRPVKVGGLKKFALSDMRLISKKRFNSARARFISDL